MRKFKFALAGMVLAVAPLGALAEKFPDKLVRIVVPFAAGGGVDQTARVLSTQLATQLGVPVIVENRAGANGVLGGRAVQTAPADGYTLLFSAATHVLARQVLSNPPYDPQTDFAPVARVGEAPLMLVIAPGLPQRKLSDVISSIRKEPLQWSAGIAAAGSPGHLATLLLAQQAQLQLSYVPYKGTQPALVDVAGGHIQMLLDSMISLQPLAKGGKVMPVIISSGKRSALTPDLPTAKESGLPDFTYASWYGVWAPKGTPPERVKALSGAIQAAVGELERQGALATLGVEAAWQDPEQFRRSIAAYVNQSADLLKGAGFKPE